MSLCHKTYPCKGRPGPARGTRCAPLVGRRPGGGYGASLGTRAAEGLARGGPPTGAGGAAVASEAGAEVVSASSLKAALDRDWDDPQARQQALRQVLTALDAVERWLATQGEAATEPSAVASMAAAWQVQAQDVAGQADGRPPLRQGVAPGRRITIEDAAMRHGHKRRRQRIAGDKRQVVRDLERGVGRAVISARISCQS